MILLALSTPSIHACGVDDGPRYLAPVPRPVLSVGRFSQALLGHSCQAPKPHPKVLDILSPPESVPTSDLAAGNDKGTSGRTTEAHSKPSEPLPFPACIDALLTQQQQSTVPPIFSSG